MDCRTTHRLGRCLLLLLCLLVVQSTARARRDPDSFGSELDRHSEEDRNRLPSDKTNLNADVAPSSTSAEKKHDDQEDVSREDEEEDDDDDEEEELSTTTKRHRHHHGKKHHAATATATTTTVAEPRRTPPSVNATHPYMTIIYEEIERDAHLKWKTMGVAGATVRGIEAIKAVNDHHSAATILEFNVDALIRNQRDIHQLDLVLTRPGSPEDHLRQHGRGDGGDDLYEVELLDAATSARRTGSVVRALYRRKAATGERQHFVVLELKPFLETWFRAHLGGYMLWPNIMHLRVAPVTATTIASTTGAETDLAVRMWQQRPLLVFYYVAGAEEQSRERRALPSSVGRGRRSPPSAFQPPKLCSRCAKGTRKTPRPDPQQLISAVHSHRDEACVLHSYEVSLEQLQWEGWVIAPPEIKMNYCAGSCKAPIVETYFNATYNSIVRSTLLEQEPSGIFAEVPAPCCVPTTMLPANILYFESNSQFIIKGLENMVAKNCGCR